MQPNSNEMERIFRAALAEDIGPGDATTNALVPEDTHAEAVFVARQPLVVCGAGWIPRLFFLLDPTVQAFPKIADGSRVESGTTLLVVKGRASAILAGERAAINIVQRLCAVATLTRRYVELIAGTKAIILDTRKTMPGLRVLDKYAVAAGGGQNHRFGLYDGIFIKDNHLALCGSVSAAVARAKAASKLPVIVECDTLEQVQEALATEADRLLLDNMDVGMLKEAVTLAKGRKPLEASGNVSLENVRAVAETGVDFISIGRLTHSAPAVDIGLDIAM